MELQTPRLRLDALHEQDAGALLGYRGDPEVARYQGWQPQCVAHVQRFIHDQVGMASPVAGSWFQRAIRLREDDRLIGDLGLCLSADHQAEVGITLAPAHQGRGYAREALAAVLEALFRTMGVHRVHASVDPRNLPSVNLMRALGLRQEAHFRQSLMLRGEWVDDLVFALLAHEWSAPPAENAGEAASR
ncbi:GNAT family N-acetyltransferase [Dyella soli]|uniref:N-acetyltransferase n=1 Tax=Dyella soli TaxID=522319 RepID=A0A4R0YW87_9GAMM|nr:GNAT family protein [Dyella soli]TCI09744.1 N-acetyltransferase [Dyella soli]